jgi:phosphohistidine phosphatase
MRLYLCRHAEAIDATGLGDEARWLTARGRADAFALGQSLARWGESAELWLSSPLVRAVQTAEGLTRGLGFTGPIGLSGALSTEGRLGQLLAELEEQPAASVAVVGHEPQLGDWTVRLCGQRPPRGFERSGVFRVDFAGPPAPGRGRPVFYASPGAGRTMFEPGSPT